MKFRLKCFGFHLLGSACMLTLLLGGLYYGWYQWPGWYLTGVFHVTAILGGVDVTLGPLVTLLIANPKKPRRELARDISIVAAVQLIALVYGAGVLWHGRPLYYTFTVNRLVYVQAWEIPADEMALAQKQNPDLAPHWYSRPRWVFIPPPKDDAGHDKAGAEAVVGGMDSIHMPRYFKPWAQGLADLREHLKTLRQVSYMFSKQERRILEERMTSRGFAVDKPCVLFLTGHDRPLLAVFDRNTLEMKALLRVD